MNPSDEVRARIDIVQLVSETVALKKAGRLYKACCPFHQEKTPSFVVYPEGRWQCFGACATGGDVFSFVMKRDNLTFGEALEKLAAVAGVTLKERTPEDVAKRSGRERLLAAMRAATDFYHAQLMRTAGADLARDYLRTRGFGSNDAARFELGWAPDSFSALTEALKEQGFSEEELLGAGLVRTREGGGGVFDTFRGRLIIPIANTRGQPIAFGARTLDPQGLPKYINSPQSEIFDKSHTVYGLHLAAKGIRDAGEAVVVEGYTDVMRAHQAGYPNVVASMGTALTEDQLASLKRYGKKIVLALDADAAGQAATLRGLEVAQGASSGDVVPVPSANGLVRYESRLKIDLFVATLAGGKDPDEILRDHPETWPKLIAGARPVMDFLFETLLADLDLDDPRGKSAAADRLLPLIGALGDPVAQSGWAGRLAQRLHVEERALAGRLARETSKQTQQRARRGTAPAVVPSSASDLGPMGEPAARRGGRRAREAAAEVMVPVEPGQPEPPEETLELNLGLRDPGVRLATGILGHLLVDRRRLLLLNEALRALDQPVLLPEDFEQTIDRNMFEAIRFAVHGAPPPDLPREHRLDALPDTMRRYAEGLQRQVQTNRPPEPEATLIERLKKEVLLLRLDATRKRRSELESLWYATEPSGRAAIKPEINHQNEIMLRLEFLAYADKRRPETGKVDRGVR